MKRALHLWLLCFMLFTPPLHQANGGEIDPASGLSGEVRAAYLAALKDPYNLNELLRAARLLEQSGDRDAAIRLYERMLIIDSRLHGVRLRAAYLEARLGNTVGALAHLERLEGMPLNPAEASARQRLMQNLQDRNREHDVEGRAFAGMTYHSNANAAPSGDVFILGFPGTQVAGADPHDALGVYASLDLLHQYDPGRQDGIVWANQLGFTGEKLFQETEFDFGFLTLRTGPVIPGDPALPNSASVQPFMEIELLSFDQEFYSATPYVGVFAQTEVNPQLALSATGRVGWRLHGPGADVNFTNRQDAIDILPGELVDLPVRLARDRDGLVLTASAEASWIYSPDLLISGGPIAMIDDAKDDSASFGRVGLQARTTWFIDNAPIPGAPAELSLSLLYLHDLYFEPETQVTSDPATCCDRAGLRKRQDNFLSVGLDSKFPLNDQLAITAGVGWTRVFSNIENFAYKDITANMGIEFAF